MNGLAVPDGAAGQKGAAFAARPDEGQIDVGEIVRAAGNAKQPVANIDLPQPFEAHEKELQVPRGRTDRHVTGCSDLRGSWLACGRRRQIRHGIRAGRHQFRSHQGDALDFGAPQKRGEQREARLHPVHRQKLRPFARAGARPQIGEHGGRARQQLEGDGPVHMDRLPGQMRQTCFQLLAGVAQLQRQGGEGENQPCDGQQDQPDRQRPDATPPCPARLAFGRGRHRGQGFVQSGVLRDSARAMASQAYLELAATLEQGEVAPSQKEPPFPLYHARGLRRSHGRSPPPRIQRRGSCSFFNSARVRRRTGVMPTSTIRSAAMAPSSKAAREACA